MNKNVVIIGGGIIGLSTAYYLVKEGYSVTIIDQGNVSSGASFVNAGYISPSHIIPLASPGIITKGIKWMFNPSSPFYIKPRLDVDFLKWSWNFKKSSTINKVEKAIPVLKNISVFSRELYKEIYASSEFNFSLEQKGLLMCYKTDKAGEEEMKVKEKAISEGLDVEALNLKEVNELEKGIDLDIKGAVYYKCDAHMTPNEYMNNMIAFLKSKKVKFYKNEEVLNLKINNSKIQSLETNKQQLFPDEIVLAAGAWSPLLTKKIGLKIPTQAGKGYCINVERPTGISIPAILMEAKVAVTPMNGFTRFAGTMELGGINNEINSTRVKAIANAAKSYYNGIEINQKEIQQAKSGLRPCTPDGLPYIGKSSKINNLTIATGHAMMGWTMGPATGKLVSEIISNKRASLDLAPFSPERNF